MNRGLRWSPIPAALLVVVAGGCGGKSPDGIRADRKSSRSETIASERSSGRSAEEATAPRTIVLHVTGMMKSKSGAT